MVSEADRLQELEMRINALERELSAREGGTLDLGKMLGRLVPGDVRQHLRAAQRENMLAVRAYLDRMIDSVEQREEDSAGKQRRRVHVD